MENSRRYLISGDEKGTPNVQHINWVFREIEERFNELEYREANNGKMPEISRGQKMTLLLELKVIDYLTSLNISQSKLASLLSLLINNSASNIEADLVEKYDPNGSLKTKRNYQFAADKFRDLGLKEYEEHCLQELKKLNSL